MDEDIYTNEEYTGRLRWLLSSTEKVLQQEVRRWHSSAPLNHWTLWVEIPREVV